jgi:hypothetical protein
MMEYRRSAFGGLEWWNIGFNGIEALFMWMAWIRI